MAEEQTKVTNRRDAGYIIALQLKPQMQYVNSINYNEHKEKCFAPRAIFQALILGLTNPVTDSLLGLSNISQLQPGAFRETQRGRASLRGGANIEKIVIFL